jgi:GxxExxY protein
MNENDISYGVRGAAFKVHTVLGPGLLESVYHAAMAYELRKAGYVVRTEVGIPVIYDDLFEVF